MARRWLTNLDLGQNELQNAKIQNLASDPGSPTAGQVYFNTTSNVLRFYNGTSWEDVGASVSPATTVTAMDSFGLASVVGTGTAFAREDHRHATPTHDGAAHAAISLSALATPTGDVAWGAHKLTGLLDPTSAQDAATKNYVDNAIAGLAWKDPVRAASTADVAIASALVNGLVMDGVALATGDRVLLKNQTTAAENGIYVVVAAGAAARATDADTAGEIQSATTYVLEGTVAGGTTWTLTTAGALTLGTTALSFAQFSGASAATAGAGLTASGNVFAVGAGAGISVTADAVAIDPAVVVRKYATNVGDGAATSISVTHSLGTRDVTVALYQNSSPWDEVLCDVQHATADTLTLLFAVAPSNGQYRCVVHG